MGGLYINKSPVSGRWGGVRSSTRTEIPAKGVEANNPEAERSARGGAEDVAVGNTLFPATSGLYGFLVMPNGQGEVSAVQSSLRAAFPDNLVR